MIYNPIIVYDFETDGVDANKCQPIQIAAMVINPRTLDYYKDTDGAYTSFNSLMRPNMDTFDDYSTTIHKKTREMLEVAPLPGQVWTKFSKWVRRWNLGHKNDDYSSPIPAGFNINGYDRVIVDRLCVEHKIVRPDGRQGIFNSRLSFDVMQMSKDWFWWSKEPKSLSLDNLRLFFGLSKEGAHDALKDVKDTGDILIKFMGLTEQLGKKVKFVNCFGDNPRRIGEKEKPVDKLTTS